MDAAGIIWRLRNGDPPTQDELNWFAEGLADQSVSDAQAGAFAMAVCLNGLGDAGRRDLTLAMRDSGATLSWEVDAQGLQLPKQRRATVPHGKRPGPPPPPPPNPPPNPPPPPPPISHITITFLNQSCETIFHS